MRVSAAYMLVPVMCDWAARHGMRIHAEYAYDPIGDAFVFEFFHDGHADDIHRVEFDFPLHRELDQKVVEQITTTIRITQP